MERKVSKKSLIVFIVAAALCLISMMGSHFVQVSGGTKMYTFTGTLGELGEKIDDNLAGNGKIVDVTFERDYYKELSFSVIIPKNATAENPAPVIITTPGDSSSKENQMPNNIELARRGFVVLSMNYSGNMETDSAINDLTNGTNGMTAVVEYAISLDCTDNTKVGLVGHSYGNGNCCNTVNFLNNETENNHISAWLLEGTVDYAFPKSGWYAEKIMENPQDLYFGVICSKYDEWDNWYDDAVNFLTGDLAKEAVQNFYPEYSDDKIKEGVWYSSDGLHEYNPDKTEGAVLGTGGGIAIWNPAINHNMTISTNYGPDKVVTTMYAAFGVPEGAEYLSPDRQIWGMAHVFTFLGVVGFFMLFFPMIDILLCTKCFASLRRSSEEEAEPAPSLKSWKELVPLVITTIALTAFAFLNFPGMWTYGYTMAFDETYNRPLANAAGYFTMWCGIATFVMIIVSSFLRRLFHLKDGTVVRNPFESLKLKSFTEFVKTIVFSLLVVIAMFIPVWFAYYVFQTDFRMNLILDRLQVQIDQPQDYITFFVKYLPFWLIFYIPNAVINANTRFKNLPEWASTIWCVVMNAMGVLLYEVIQYYTVFTRGYFHWVGDNETWCGLCGVSMVLTISFAAFSARYAYKKTNSAWVGAIINAVVMGLLMFVSSGAVNDLML